jgi:hypothetical protein
MNITLSLATCEFVTYLSVGKVRFYKLPMSINSPEYGELDSIKLIYAQNSRELIKVEVGCCYRNKDKEDVFIFSREVEFDDNDLNRGNGLILKIELSNILKNK